MPVTEPISFSAAGETRPQSVLLVEPLPAPPPPRPAPPRPPSLLSRLITRRARTGGERREIGMPSVQEAAIFKRQSRGSPERKKKGSHANARGIGGGFSGSRSSG